MLLKERETSGRLAHPRTIMIAIIFSMSFVGKREGGECDFLKQYLLKWGSMPEKVN